MQLKDKKNKASPKIHFENNRHSFNKASAQQSSRKSAVPNKNRKATTSLFFRILAASFMANLAFVGYFAMIAYQDFTKEKILEIEFGAERLAIEMNGFLDYSESLLNSVNDSIAKRKSYGAESSEVLFLHERIRNRNGSRSGLLGDGNLYWIDSNKYLIASSFGKVKKPINLSSRDYLDKSQHKLRKLIIGKPVSGALSNQKIIPFAVGAVGENNRYIGTSVLSISVENLIDNLKKIDKNRAGEFVILDYDKKILLESNKEFFSENKNFMNLLSKMNLSDEDGKVDSIFTALRYKKNFIVKKTLLEHKLIVIYAIHSQELHDELLKKMRFYLGEGLFLACSLLFLLVCA